MGQFGVTPSGGPDLNCRVYFVFCPISSGKTLQGVDQFSLLMEEQIHIVQRNGLNYSVTRPYFVFVQEYSINRCTCSSSVRTKYWAILCEEQLHLRFHETSTAICNDVNLRRCRFLHFSLVVGFLIANLQELGEIRAMRINNDLRNVNEL